MENLRDGLQLRYLRRMVKTPAGRAFLLNQLADAESNGENQVFERPSSRSSPRRSLHSGRSTSWFPNRSSRTSGRSCR